LKWGAVAFRDRYRHCRAVNETHQEFRAIHLEILDDTIFNSMGQSKIHGHSHSPLPFAGRYPFWTASSSDRYPPACFPNASASPLNSDQVWVTPKAEILEAGIAALWQNRQIISSPGDPMNLQVRSGQVVCPQTPSQGTR
jgi:hypothetical protein